MNKCLGCPRNCCLNFKVTIEITNPDLFREELASYPFIKRVGSDVVLGPHGKERVVGVYSCDRFDAENGVCKNYDTQKRGPVFAKILGLFLFLIPNVF